MNERKEEGLPGDDDLGTEREVRALLVPAVPHGRAPLRRIACSEGRRWLRSEYLVSAGLSVAVALFFVAVQTSKPAIGHEDSGQRPVVAGDQEELKGQVDELIRQLGDDDFQSRKHAAQELAGLLEKKSQPVARLLQARLRTIQAPEAAGRLRALLDAWLARPAWSISRWADTDFLSPPVVAGARVFGVWSDAEALICWRAEDGVEIWRAKEVRTGYAPAAVAGSRVFVANRCDDTLACFRAEDGKRLWSLPLEGLPAAERKVTLGDGTEHEEVNEFPAPICADGSVYLGTGGGKVHAVNETDGRPRWTYATGSPIVAAVCAREGRVFAACRNGTLHAVDADTGRKLWVYAAKDAAFGLAAAPGSVGAAQTHEWASPAAASGLVVWSPSPGKLLALDFRKGSACWTWTAPRQGLDGDFSAPVLARERVLVNTPGGRLYALEAASGRVAWVAGGPAQKPAADWRSAGVFEHVGAGEQILRGDGAMAPPAVLEGAVVAGGEDGVLRAYRLENGKLIWSLRTGGPLLVPPALADGKLFCDGKGLSAFHVLEPETPAAWPMFRGGASGAAGAGKENP